MQAMVTARAIIDMQKQRKKYGNLEIDVKINITFQKERPRKKFVDISEQAKHK